MRLIDADALIKNLSYLYTKNHIPVDMRSKEILTTIMEQPTAYDVDKVVEELELHSFELGTDTLPAHYIRLNDAIEIVKQEAERCNSGWILCSERFPDECVPVNVTYINRNPEPYYAKIKDVPFSATAVYYNGKWYWYSSACVDYLTEYGKNDFDLVDKDIDIIAWMELPSAYIPKEK